MQEIQNPGSALGEAIGGHMEEALNAFLAETTQQLGYHFISRSPKLNAKGVPRKLLLHDKFGTAYNIDAVITNESMQPIVLVESKYIRYKKHNRDKGSWICTAHPAIRRRYPSVRSSIAVLAGNWSSSSLAMMKSFNINLFLIPFQSICDVLSPHAIDFNWEEKDRAAATQAWRRYTQLTPEQQSAIGTSMVNGIKAELYNRLYAILDDSLPRQIDHITLELHSNLGEVTAMEFGNLAEAVDYLNTVEMKNTFISQDSPTLFDPPPVFDDHA